MSAETPKLVQLVSQGRETDQTVKDEAFRLWIGMARSWKRVSEQTGIAESTLRLWGQRENWEDRRKDAAAAFLPGVLTESALSLRMAAYYASVRLQQIMHDAAELGIPPDDREVKALGVAIDRGGFSPVGKSTGPEVTLTQPDQISVESLVGKSSDELMRLEEQFKARKR